MPVHDLAGDARRSTTIGKMVVRGRVYPSLPKLPAWARTGQGKRVARNSAGRCRTFPKGQSYVTAF